MKRRRKTDRQTVQQVQIEVMHSSVWQKCSFTLYAMTWSNLRRLSERAGGGGRNDLDRLEQGSG